MSTEFENLVNRSYESRPKYTEMMTGLPEDYKQIKTLRDLLDINYKLVGAKEQIRGNLISKIKSNAVKYPGIIGLEDDVVPSLDRAILSLHDVILVGQIGQAKTRIARIIAEHLLSPIPVIHGSITNDCPMDLPAIDLIYLLEDKEATMSIPKFYIDSNSMKKIRDNKLDTPIEWREGKDRFKYVLATPDISVKDLVGQIDAIKVTRNGTEMYQIESYSPGQLMQAKHGLFCIDELPVLDTRKQVALLSVLQEGRFTTGAYPIVFEPKTVFFATANPIDYTHSGKIIEPLYDRLKSHIHTHYPKSLKDEMIIITQEARIQNAFIPIFILKLLARIIQSARTSNEINQDKGVSVRMGIHSIELLVAESERTRSISHNITAVPRPSDIFCINQSIKFELAELDDTKENREKILKNLIDSSLRDTSLEYVKDTDVNILESIKKEFNGKAFQVSQGILGLNSMQSSYDNQLKEFPSLSNAVITVLKKIESEQEEFIKDTQKYEVPQNAITISKESHNELKAAVAELVVEGLCWVEPKVLEKKESTYVAA